MGGRRPRRVQGLLVATISLALAAACAPPESRGRQPSGRETPAGPQRGGRLTVAVPEPASIDPSRAADAERGGLRPGVLVLSLICDPLVGANPITGVLKPGVAESWTIAPDAKKVIFRLRAGVRFHNGRELVAQDYVYSLSRFAHPDTGSVQHFFLEKVAGYQDVRRRRAAELTGVRAPDPRTLEVELSEPFAELPALLSHPAAGSAVPKEEVDKGAEAFGRAPVCTGPYRPAAPWAPGSGEIRLARFNDYVAGGPDSPLGAGFADEIVLKTVPDAEAGYALFEREALEASEVPIGRLSAAREGKVGVEGGSNGLLAYLGFPAGKPPFDKADFRRALSLAIDRQAIVEGVFAGSRQVPAGFLPPAAGPGSPANACPETVKGRADPKAAAVALMSSGLDPASTKPPIYFNDAGSGHAIWIAKVAEQWKAGLGIEPSLQAHGDFQTYLGFLAGGGADGPFRLAWLVDYPSPEALFGPVFAGGSLDNYTGFKSQEFDDLLARARGAADDKARGEIYAQAGAVLCREMPVVPMWFGMNHIAFSPLLRATSRQRLGLRGEPLLRELGRASVTPRGPGAP